MSGPLQPLQGWIPPVKTSGAHPPPQYHQDHAQPQLPRTGVDGGVNMAAAPEARAMFGYYPIVQHTPSSRVARDLSSMTLTRPPPIHPAQLFPSHAQPINRLLNHAGGVQTQNGSAQHEEAINQARRLMEQYAPNGRLRNDSGVAPSGAPISEGHLNGNGYHLPPPPNLSAQIHHQSTSTVINLSEHPTQWRIPTGGGAMNDPFLVAGNISHPTRSAQAVLESSPYTQSMVSAFLLADINAPSPLYPLHNPHHHVQSFTQTVNGVMAGRTFVDSYVEDITRRRMAQKERDELVVPKGASVAMNGRPSSSSEPSSRNSSTSQRHHHQQPRNLAPAPYVAPSTGPDTDITGPSPDPLSFSGSPMKRKSSHLHNAVSSGPQSSPTKMVKIAKGKHGRDFTAPPAPSSRESESPHALIEDGFRGPEQSDVDVEEEDEGEEDQGGDEDYGMYDETAAMGTPSGKQLRRARGLSGSGKTGDRDLRGHHQKLVDLVDNIFEEEDVLSGNLTPEALESATYFFRASTKDSNVPLLSPSTVVSLTSYISRVSKLNGRPDFGVSASRSKGNEVTETPSRLANWDIDRLLRLLEILERSVMEGENARVFVMGSARKERERSESPTKGKGRGKAPRKKKNGELPEAEETEQEEPSAEEDSEERNKFQSGMERLTNAITAAEACLATLSATDMPKQIYSEDLLSRCFTVIDFSLSDVIMPVAEAISAPNSSSSSVLRCIASKGDAESIAYRSTVESLFSATDAAMSRCCSLVSQADALLSEGHVSQAVYMSLGPLFTFDKMGEKGAAAKAKEQIFRQVFGSKTGLQAMRMSALSLLKVLFARNIGQREWILEEVLSRLVKLSDVKRSQSFYRLRDGRTIHMITAVLLQLIQSCSYGLRDELRKVRHERVNLALTALPAQEEVGYKPVSVSSIEREKAVFDERIEAAARSSVIVFRSLMQKISTGTPSKSGKATSELEYKGILDTILSDIVTVLYLPEWPVASVVVTVATKLLTSALSQPKAVGETTTLRLLAADHLGLIAAKLRSLEVSGTNREQSSFEQIANSPDPTRWNRLVVSHDQVLHHLCRDLVKDSVQSNAVDFWTAQWAQGICKCYLMHTAQADGDIPHLPDLFDRLEAEVLKFASNLTDDSLFDVESQDEARLADAAAIDLQIVRPLQAAFSSILDSILLAMDANAVGVRTKAIRSLGAIITADASLLALPSVKAAFDDRLSDSSPQVRDAAVELLGKYVLQTPEFADSYYQTISHRIIDTGVSVRKRVIKIMKAIYSLTIRSNIRTDICRKLVLLVHDDDEGVKDLAVATLASIWKPHSTDTCTSARATPESAASESTSAQKTASSIMGVASYFRELNGPLDEVVYEIVAKDHAEWKIFLPRILDVLLEYLIEADEKPEVNIFSCIRACHVLCNTMPSIVTVEKAVTLLPYLQSGGTPEEQSMTDMLMRVFTLSIPFMPKTATTFAMDLTKALLPMINKPLRGTAALPETVACYCSAVMHLTHEYGRVIAIYRSCQTKISGVVKTFGGDGCVPPHTLKALPMLLAIASSLASYCDLDTVKGGRPDVAEALGTITEGKLSDHAYDMLMSVRQLPLDNLSQQTLMQSLGSLFHAHPVLMLRETTTGFMDQILSSDDFAAQELVYKLIQGFLIDEAAKKDSERVAKMEKGELEGTPKGVNINELVGDTAGFAESGVASAVVQRYLSGILVAALSSHEGVQRVAMDIVSFTVRQGLAHPNQCLPVLISLETSRDSKMADAAFALHTLLHNKHASHLNSKYVENARAAFKYQQNFDAEPSGFRRAAQSSPALLEQWYSLVRDKRAPRQDFLKALPRCFEFDAITPAMSRDELMFCRFIADNLAQLDYKTQEEVLLVITQLNQVLSTSGMHLVDTLMNTEVQGAPDAFIADLRLGVRRSVVDSDQMALDSPNVSPPDLLSCATSVGIALLLKSQLQNIYGLSEDRCAKYRASAKTPGNDKPAARKVMQGFEEPDWSRLRGVDRPAVTVADFEGQKEALLALIEEDGTMGEYEIE